MIKAMQQFCQTKHVRPLVFIAALALSAPVIAQEFPTRPVHMVVSFSPGGSTDILARMIAVHMGDKFGQAMLVENRPGANSTIGPSTMARAPADGYTLLIQDLVPVSRIFNKALTYDTDKDFDPVSGVYRGLYALSINASLPVKTLKEYIDYAKANPGKMNYGIPFISAQLTMELFKNNAGINVVGIPYKGSAPTLQALMANEIQATVDLPGVMTPFVKDNRARVLAIAGEQRLAQMPDVPTFAELGYPNVKASLAVGLWTPAGTPAPILAKLNAVAMDAVKAPDVTAHITADGSIPFASSPADLRKYYRAGYEFWSEAARIAKFVPEN